MSNIRYIPLSGKLSNGSFAQVDAEDYEYLNRWTWRAWQGRYTLYACATLWVEGRKREVKMHRLVLSRKLERDLGKHELVDHDDRHGLNNTRKNLRLATYQENSQNRVKHVGENLYKGISKVSGSKGTRPWAAYICLSGQDFFLGCYETQEEAGRAYASAAKFHFGEFALSDFQDAKPMSANQIHLAYKASLTALSLATGKSKFLGVCPTRNRKKWLAYYSHEKKQHVIGRFETEIEAARARDVKVLELGLSSPLNFSN